MFVMCLSRTGRRIIPSGSPELPEQSKQCANLRWEAEEEQEVSTYAAMNWGHGPTWEVGSLKALLECPVSVFCAGFL
uniref:Uncharacterized protein n=1 Tax=Pavo cristatus TaxID=9049 RepID=A0A8C9FDW5_PAVCR